jgi:hypothetical protein
VGFGLSNNILPFFSYLSPTPSIFSVLFSSSSLNLSSLFLCSTSVTISFLLCGVVSTKPNSQPGGPGYLFLSVSS